MALTKTGEVFYREINGDLCIAESFVDDGGVVTTQSTLISPAQPETTSTIVE
jgi:hypothetical protein